MKRFISVLICLCLVLSVLGCNTPDPEHTDPSSQNSGDETSPSVPLYSDPAAIDIYNPIQVNPDDPEIVFLPQSGDYQESLLLANVPGQKAALLLSARSDGTADYIFSQQDKELCGFASDTPLQDAGYQYYIVKPDGSYEKQDDQWMGQLEDAMVASVAAADKDRIRWKLSFWGSEGNIVIECALIDDLSETRRTFYCLQDGALTQIPMRSMETETTYDGISSKIVVGEGVSIVSAVNDGFYSAEELTVTLAGKSATKSAWVKYSFDGAVQEVYCYDDPNLLLRLDVTDEIAWFANTNRSRVIGHSFRSGEYRIDQVRAESNILSATATRDGKGLLMLSLPYSGDSNQILLEYYEAETGGSLVEDSAHYAFGNPGATPRKIAAVSKDVFYTWAQGTINGALMRYVYNPEAKQETNTTFTVYSLEDNHTVRTTVALWNSAHPENQCEYIVAKELYKDSALTEEDLIAQLNVQLVNGEGPDVLILDGLPVDSLIRKGFLEPLDHVDTSEVYDKLLDRFKLNDTLYAVPGKMTPYLLGRMSKFTVPVESLSSFADLVEEKSGKLNCAFWGGTQKIKGEGTASDAIYWVQFADEVFDLWYPAWSDTIWQDGSFCSEQYQELLYHTGRLVEHYSLETTRELIAVYGEFEKGGLVREGFSVINQTDVALQDIDKDVYGAYPYYLVATSYVGISSYISSIHLQKPVPYEVAGIPGPDGSGAAVLTAIGALRAGGNVTDGAKFLELMLSDSVQTALPYYGIHASDGYPVTWRATPALLEKTEDFCGLKTQITNDLETELGSLRGIVLDEVLYNAARETALSYYEGEISLEEAVRQVQERIGIYLAEQRS